MVTVTKPYLCQGRNETLAFRVLTLKNSALFAKDIFLALNEQATISHMSLPLC